VKDPALLEKKKDDDKAEKDNEQRIYTVIRGKFKEKKVIQMLKKEDEIPEGESKELIFEIEEYKKKKIYFIKKGAYAFVFVSDSILATGNIKVIKEMLDIKGGKAKYAGRNTAILKLLPPIVTGNFMWSVIPNLAAQEEKDDKQGSLDIPDNGILMQGRGRGWGRGRGNRGRGDGDRRNPIGENLRGEIWDQAHDYRDLQNMGGVYNGALGMGMEAHLFSMMKSGGKLTDYIMLVMQHRFKDKETVNQRALELRRYKELYTNAKGAGVRLPEILGFLKDMEVVAKGDILKTSIRMEKDEFKKLQKQLTNMFAKGIESEAPSAQELKPQELKQGEEF
jgi:hypothetical protein